MERLCRVGQFAVLTGLSIRTLHHYDRIGLLRPADYSEGGHRLYAERDLLRLQQILTLRYLGFSLAQIGALLDRPDFDLVASMRIQRGVLRDRISELERIRAALDELLERRLATGLWAWELVAKASAAVQDGLARKGAKMAGYYTPEQMRQFEEIGKRVSPEERAEVERQWTELLAEVRANRALDPASPAARALADRWNALSQATAERWQALVQEAFPGDQQLLPAIADNYRQNRFADVEGAPHAEDLAFIERVNAARKPPLSS